MMREDHHCDVRVIAQPAAISDVIGFVFLGKEFGVRSGVLHGFWFSVFGFLGVFFLWDLLLLSLRNTKAYQEVWVFLGYGWEVVNGYCRCFNGNYFFSLAIESSFISVVKPPCNNLSRSC